MYAPRIAHLDPLGIIACMRTSILLLLLYIAASARAADTNPTPADYLALYAIVPDDAFNRKFGTGFSYEKVFSNPDAPKTVNGIYMGKPILTIEHIAKVDIETREIQTAPIPGLRFVLSDLGARTLQDYLRQPGASEMVAFIDGHAYSTVSLDLARHMVERRVFFVVLPSPQESTTRHFLKLLAAKLQSAIHAR